jgi:hypothetical protein
LIFLVFLVVFIEDSHRKVVSPGGRAGCCDWSTGPAYRVGLLSETVGAGLAGCNVVLDSVLVESSA